ncbi:MAG: phosphatase PAP2 family protein [Imperialibacter sp.]|uniref:phosphatase PAP2 family protein n=1 Tax=Imperialibacter sp. TaxID=2038411 RepID=UPI0030D94605
MNWLIELDQQFFLWLNSHHASWLDGPMLLITGRNTWIPLYLALIAWLIYQQKKEAAWSILAIVLTIVIADQLTSGLMKPFFERLRPCHDPAIASLVHLVDGCGGKFGFASSHAANTFALATFVSLLHTGKAYWHFVWYAWAAIVTYSRIYVGVHYPGDVLVGALVGIAAAYIIYLLGRKTGRLKHV